MHVGALCVHLLHAVSPVVTASRQPHRLQQCRNVVCNATLKCAQAFSSWQFLLVDLRCHGDSAHIQTASQGNSVESAAADVLELLRHLKLFPEVLIGHSFGGKVVMSMADQFGRIGPRLPRPVQVRLSNTSLQPSRKVSTISCGPASRHSPVTEMQGVLMAPYENYRCGCSMLSQAV